MLYFIILVPGSVVLFLSVNRDEKLKVLRRFLPASVISGILWFILIGPRVLPVVAK